jgi:hypothetical protein
MSYISKLRDTKWRVKHERNEQRDCVMCSSDYSAHIIAPKNRNSFACQEIFVDITLLKLLFRNGLDWLVLCIDLFASHRHR